jgi:hypothetical protein
LQKTLWRAWIFVFKKAWDFVASAVITHNLS